MVAGPGHRGDPAGLASCSLYAGGGHSLPLYVIIIVITTIIIHQETTLIAVHSQAGKTHGKNETVNKQ